MASDKPPQPPGKTPRGEGDPPNDLEKELDAVIAKASSLVNDLAGELGPADAGTGGSDDPVLCVTAPTTQKIEEGLNELDHLVSRTRAEVGGEPPSPDKPAAKPDSGGASGASNYYVPDFMSEFTRPQPTVEPKPSRSAPAAAPEKAAPSPRTVAPASISPTVVPSVPGGRLGMVGTPLRPGVTHPGAPQSTAMTSVPAILIPPGDEPPSSKFGVVSLALTMAMSVAVTLLELFDRPFKPVRDAAKQLLGWIAIATIGASLVVLAGEWL
jgi:hypothetical protein